VFYASKVVPDTKREGFLKEPFCVVRYEVGLLGSPSGSLPTQDLPPFFHWRQRCSLSPPSSSSSLPDNLLPLFPLVDDGVLELSPSTVCPKLWATRPLARWWVDNQH